MPMLHFLVAILAADPSGWTTVREIPAPEAHQAAATDERYFYAITSKSVAKYDRETGSRVAVSTGPAEHLNSGFLWNNRLYCAHSNYPRLPERSEIKVLDTASMQLTTFHDFGNYGGSLTWCLRRENRWWCHFAKYGAANGESFLVEFDESWKELRRFTWPKAVIERIGKNSLSGAVWRGDELLATGHDDPVLFRVRLPQQGAELEFVGTQSIPFTGQGIAFDPVTDGLIGINRKEKKLILARPPRS
ncbi:MAG TPA: hypothetical protein VM510_03075 [Caulifigura sp.]|nr:hypothetical protein [Caulifigura sp.]